jgi:hypothetical protein
MRLLLPLVALCALSSVPLRADMFDITLSGTTLSGSGTFTTDGTCSLCKFPGFGLLSLTINIGPDSGADAFDLSTSQRGRGAEIGDGTERWREHRATRELPDD